MAAYKETKASSTGCKQSPKTLMLVVTVRHNKIAPCYR